MRKLFLAFMLALTVFGVYGCQGIAPMPEKMPDDFDFTIAWGINKLNSYNSRTNLLIKDIGDEGSASVPLFITDDKMNEIYDNLLAIDILSYPHEVNLYGESYMITPSFQIEIIIMYKWGSYTINIPCVDEMDGEEIVTGQELLAVCKEIVEYIKSTDEYKSLPPSSTIYI
ncbi:MAG: hypothetical protein WC479_08125 [Candidatus Izemoplasmatales bacterium]|jgi:hypothetical protein|nr:hypothetical protein [Candidatus Izemoplasmatales bacterium]